MADAKTYKDNIVTRYLADTTKFEGTTIRPVAFIDSRFVPGSFYAECVWFSEPSEGSPPEHCHDEADEILMFFGSDSEHPHDLGGEVELWVEGEKLTITESSMVFIPKGVKHCPMYFRRVDRPIIHLSTMPSQGYSRDGME
ncbi:MAG: hypothetical protein GX630_07455 [Actinobacteria bacterium]|nr:hypothetical protein [Actinomycetota bacterium]